jgi:hypothetical protein
LRPCHFSGRGRRALASRTHLVTNMDSSPLSGPEGVPDYAEHITCINPFLEEAVLLFTHGIYLKVELQAGGLVARLAKAALPCL